MTRDEYRRFYSTGHSYKGHTVQIPANVERREHHEPCFLCGQARGCKHRRAA